MRHRRILCTTVLPFFLGLTTLFYKGGGHQWWRAHAGDTILIAFLVGLLGTLTRLSLPVRLAVIAAYSTTVEISQLLPGAEDRGSIVALVLGTHFDGYDFIYYAVGLLIAAVLDQGASPASIS